MSPFFILARRLASIAYLRVFGSLARMTIPWAKREGDKHFADRGVLGIYLGPSEVSPGGVIYVPATRRFYTSRDVICYEDTLPGVKHVDSHWRDLDDLSAPTEIPSVSLDPVLRSVEPVTVSQPNVTGEPTNTSQPPTDVTESPAFDLPPPTAHSDEINAPDDELSLDRLRTTAGVDSDQHLTPRSVRQKLPAHDSGDPSDPSSRERSRANCRLEKLGIKELIIQILPQLPSVSYYIHTECYSPRDDHAWHTYHR